MIQRVLPFVTLIVLFVGLAIASPHFLSQTNLSSVVRQTAVINIMALGMTLIIITGGIDLSVGSAMGMAGFFGALAMQNGSSILVGILVGDRGLEALLESLRAHQLLHLAEGLQLVEIVTRVGSPPTARARRQGCRPGWGARAAGVPA